MKPLSPFDAEEITQFEAIQMLKGSIFEKEMIRLITAPKDEPIDNNDNSKSIDSKSNPTGPYGFVKSTFNT